MTVKAGKPFITLTPAEARVAMGATQLFTAQGSSLNGPIQWSILETGGGTIGTDGTYTAPNVQGTFTVVAQGTSLAGASVFGSSRVTVGALLIQAPTQLLLYPGDTFAFTASQLNGATNPLAWSIDEGAVGGAIGSDGAYTAPLQPGIFHVRVSNGTGESAVQEVIVTLIDAIVISPRVDVLEEGDYIVSVSLQASNSKKTTRKVSAHLTVGLQDPELTFKADTLKTDLGVDGPYQVVGVQVEKATPDDMVPADTPKDLGATVAYRLDRLERPWISIGGQVSAQALDFDSNGLVDQLRVGFVVDLVTMGSYRWSGALVDADGLVIAHAYGGPASLAAGANVLQLAFPGTAINAHGKDGPYYLKNVMVQGPVIDGSGDWSGAITGYTANQFEPPAAAAAGAPSPALKANPVQPRKATPQKATKKGAKS